MPRLRPAYPQRGKECGSRLGRIVLEGEKLAAELYAGIRGDQLDPGFGRPAGEGRALRAFGRLKAGVSVETARATLAPWFAQVLETVPPQFRKEVHLAVRTVRERQMGDARLASWALFGGVLGVLLTIPLRRALIVEQGLKFPEGTAVAEVLRVGEGAGAGLRALTTAGGLGAAIKFGETGLQLWPGTAQAATWVGRGVAYVGSNLSPALLGIGYIVGLNIAALVFAGSVISWNIAIPIYAAHFLQDNAELPFSHNLEEDRHRPRIVAQYRRDQFELIRLEQSTRLAFAARSIRRNPKVRLPRLV